MSLIPASRHFGTLTPRRPHSISRRPPPSAFVSPIRSVGVRVRQLGRSLEFWRRVICIWTSFKVTQVYVALQRRYRHDGWPRRVWERQHERAGDMMLDLCTSMKGFYVKSGQLIALQAFIPVIIRKKLSILQDDMPPMPEAQARRVIEDELQKLGQTSEVFSSLDLSHVLGSASIAQVHRGVLREGQVPIAVKVQFPDMETLMLSDLANYRVLAEILQRTELKFDLVRPVQELGKQIAMEFDFVAEAGGMEEIRHALRKVRSVSVPSAVPGLVSRRLLVMTYLDGVTLTKLGGKSKLGDRAVKVIGRKILKNLTKCYGKMILTDGFFQADCHPGNILVRNSNIDIGLLDFGQTKRFSTERRVAFARLVDAMARKDSVGIRQGLQGLGINVVKATPSKKRAPKPRPKQSKLTIEEQLAYTMFDTAAVPGVSDNPFSENSALRYASVDKLPKDLVFLLRTMQLLRGISRATHNADFSMVSSWGDLAREELRRFSRPVPLPR